MDRDHDPEALAAAYVAEEMAARERVAFDDHLQACEVCRAEVAAGQQGKVLVHQAHETAPSWLRARISDTLTRQAPPRRRRARLLLAAAAVVLIATVGGVAALERQPPVADPVAAAVADYRQDRLPGSTPPQGPAPDLGSLQLTHVAAATGDLDGQPATGYAYRDPAGQRLTIYLSERAFPMPLDAHQLAGPAGAWTLARRGVTVLCASEPHEMLIVGENPELVEGAADTLEVT